LPCPNALATWCHYPFATNAAGGVVFETETGRLMNRKWLREPLLRFLVLGALIFLVDRLATQSTVEALALDPRTREEQRAIFTQRQGRAPNAQEEAQLAEAWLDDELLFREGMRIDLVHQDPALREQIIARMRTLLASTIAAAEPTERDLRAFYEAHRADYAIPDTVSFSEYFVPAGPRADEIVRELVRAIAAGQPVALLPMRYEARSEAQLIGSHGAELAARLMALPEGALRILRSSRGMHAIALERRTPSHEPVFETLRPTLRVELQAAQRQRAFADELTRLRARYAMREGAP
jgi:hypothetical protein